MTNESDNLPKPNFLVLGARHSGADWLRRLLNLHPDVFVTAETTPSFFSREREANDEAYARYLKRHVARATGARTVGLGSPDDFWNSRAHEAWNAGFPEGFATDIPGAAMRFMGPDTRLIVMVRDPVARAVAAYLDALDAGRLPLHARVLEAGRQHGILHRGFYHAHLEAWTGLFPTDHIKVVVYEEAAQAPERLFTELCAFLGAADAPWPEKAPPPTTNDPPHLLQDGAFHVPGDRTTKLAFWTLRKLKPDYVNLTGFHRAADRYDLADLADLYREDTQALGERLERDLDTLWLKPYRPD